MGFLKAGWKAVQKGYSMDESLVVWKAVPLADGMAVHSVSQMVAWKAGHSGFASVE